ncbi:hypothetical protein [Mesorhizobium sp.]|nr:hypothetical protein [Mesorhizobium sp.]
MKIYPDLALEGKRFKEELSDAAALPDICLARAMSCRFLPGLHPFLAMVR